MDVNFNIAIETVLHHEGGYVNNPNDPGGETKYGISKRSYPNVNIKTLSVDQAKDIYYKDWWQRYKYFNIDNVECATKILDASVNMGGIQAHKIAQRACNAAGHQLVIDGLLGRKSFTAINEIQAEVFLAAFRAEMAAYYRLLIVQRPQFKTFEKGWLRRAYS